MHNCAHYARHVIFARAARSFFSLSLPFAAGGPTGARQIALENGASAHLLHAWCSNFGAADSLKCDAAVAILEHKIDMICSALPKLIAINYFLQQQL